MARPRTPTAIHELKGTFRKHPERKREREPKPEGNVGEAPAYFSDDERAAWNELVAVVPAGVLTSADRIIVEVAARLLAKFRTDPAFKTGELDKLVSCLARMGLTPADRSKVSVPAEKQKQSFWETI